MQALNLIGTAITALAFKALNSSETLNSLVNRMTGGSINRESLAHKVLRDSVQLGLELQLNKNNLGDRSAVLAPLASKIIYDNTASDIAPAIEGLINEYLKSDTAPATGIWATVKQWGIESMKPAAASMGAAVIEPQFLEKVLATMVDKHTMQPLENYLEKSLSALPLGKSFVKNLVTDLLKRSIIADTSLIQKDKIAYNLLADMVHNHINGVDLYKPLVDYLSKAKETALIDTLVAVGGGAATATAVIVEVGAKSAIRMLDTLAIAKESYDAESYIDAALFVTMAVPVAIAEVGVMGIVMGVPALLPTAVDLAGIASTTTIHALYHAAPHAQNLYHAVIDTANAPADKSIDVISTGLAQATVGTVVSMAESVIELINGIANAKESYDKEAYVDAALAAGLAIPMAATKGLVSVALKVAPAAVTTTATVAIITTKGAIDAAYAIAPSVQQGLANLYEGASHRYHAAMAALPASTGDSGTTLSDAMGTGLREVAVSSVVVLTDGTLQLIDDLAKAKTSYDKEEYFDAALEASLAVPLAVSKVAIKAAVPIVMAASAAVSTVAIKGANAAGYDLVAGAGSLYSGAWHEADKLYNAVVGAPSYQKSSDAYASDLKTAQKNQDASIAMLPTPDVATSDSQWADALIKQQVIATSANPEQLPTSAELSMPVAKAWEQGQITTERKDTLTDLSHRLSPEQLLPFGVANSTVKVAKNISGNLAKVASESQAAVTLSDSVSQAMVEVIDAAPMMKVDKAGYKISDVYAPYVGQLALEFPEGVYSQTEATLDASKAATNYLAGSWGYADVGLADWTELRKLYNTCSGNEQQMLKISSYLYPDIALLALQSPILDQMDPDGSGWLSIQGQQVQLADTNAQFQYQLQRDGDNVLLTMTAAWDIQQYGAQHTPQGNVQSTLKSSITITVPPNGVATISDPSLHCAIHNEFQFDAYGQLAPAAAQI